jgi:nucleotide-binding universal stress UspA family protein
MEPLDLKKLAAEVSAQHGIRIDPDDPIMAVMTLNRLVFERALDEILGRLKASADDIERAAGRVQVRAGTALAQEVKEYSASIEQKTTAAIDLIVATAHRHQRNAPWLGNIRLLGLLILSALAAFAIGVYMGALLTSTGPCRG